MSSVPPIVTPEHQNNVALWRQKIADGTITLEELRQAVKELRGVRLSAVQAAAVAGKKSKSSAAAKAPPRSAEELLKGL